VGAKVNISIFGALFIAFVLIGLPVVVQIIVNKVLGSYARVQEVGKQKSTDELVSFNLTN
jgi:hypothetical protein